ncbi:MAG: rhodanese-like domain-containing protein [Thiothrix sp.]|nr:rhodanese-like domain-containing protein [Thiothrix sp.]HPE61039.1 rhodanese-like domain-containing protein [Thiolinea sp.]
MNEYIVFAQNHLLLVMGFVAVLGLILYIEFNNLTRKYKQVGTSAAVQLMNRDTIQVLDVRDDSEIRNGRIQGARHVPLGQLEKRLSEFSAYRDKPVLVYCASGNRSGMACKTLTKHGFTEVYNLAGGIGAWESDSLPLVKR